MKNRFSFILLLIFLFSNTLFAQAPAQISESLLKKASQIKTVAKIAIEEKIDVMFIPEGDNTDNIDTSFLNSRGIKYIKSRNFLSAKVPADMVTVLDQVKGVKRIELDVKIKAFETVSEGRDMVNASIYAYNGVSGESVKIAVIDVGFMNYDYLQRIGELPANLITKDFTSYGSPAIDPYYEIEEHGSACAEVIYDFVPQAQMYLCKIDTAAALQNALDYCKAQGIKIASCSIGFAVGFWCDGSGIYAAMATEAYNNGVLPVFAAGNEGETSWFGKFNGNSENWMVFPSGKDYLELYIPAHGSVYMMWDDFAARDKKYTLYMYDSSGTYEIDSSLWANGNTPNVYVDKGSGSGYVRIKIKKENTAENVNVRLAFDGSYRNSSDMIRDCSLSSPGDSRESLTAGALNVSNWSSGPIDSYSSRGPTLKTISLSQAQKPDITAPSYVTTISYGTRGFNGTSAATPHVAGSAALLLSLDRTMSVAQLKDKVLSYYRQISSSPDNNYGRGKLSLGTDLIPDFDEIGDIVCYPNPSSISKNKHVIITNLPYNTSLIDINVYTVTGEFVKSFNAGDLKSKNGRMSIEWNLKNQEGAQIAPGVYFFTIQTPVSGKKVKKIAIQK